MAIQKKSLVGKTTAKTTTPVKTKTAGPTKQKMETTKQADVFKTTKHFQI